MEPKRPFPVPSFPRATFHFLGVRPGDGKLPLRVTLLLGLVVMALTAVSTETASAGRRATLVVETDETCHHPESGSDHMISTDTVSFTIPEGDGPLELEGHYNLTGSLLGGYQMSGRSVYQGEIKNGALILRFGQWYYNGEPMPSSDPEFPSEQKTVRIAIEPDAKVVKQFNYIHDGQVPCSGTVVYRLVAEPESQTWEVFLTGYRYVIHKSPSYLLNPGAEQWTEFVYFHGVTFSYALSAEFVITKEKDAWSYTSGHIKNANVEYEYMQQPEIYKVNRTSCDDCAKVKSLTGIPLRGYMPDNNSVVLYWKVVQPTVVVQAQLGVECGPGTQESTCENLKDSAEYGIDDTDFLQRARDHILPLKQGGLAPIKDGMPTQMYEFSVVHEYTLNRVR